MKNQKTLIIGATGTVGKELMKILKSSGVSVRGTTSKPVSNSDTEMVQVDLNTGAGLEKAFENVERAFLISPPGYADQHKILSRLIQISKSNKLKKVVLMTAMGANASDNTPFRRAEIELEKSGLKYNIIRPNWFMQNFNTFWVQGIKDLGKILVPGGKASVSFIDARDISAVAAKLLMSSEHDNQDFDLSGAKAYTHDEVAQRISNATGRKIQYQEIAPETLKEGLVKAGLPVDYVEFLLLIFSFLREGYNSKVESTVQNLLGRAPISFEKYANDLKQSWL